MANVKYLWKNAIVLAVAAVFAIMASKDFLAMHVDEPIVETEYLTEIRMLSEYSENLAGSALDTEVYVFDSGVEGGTMLILGGTHPNETAGLLAAIGMIENMNVTQGRVFVIPWTNKGGFTHTSPLDGMQDFVSLTLDDGSVRTFRVGNRLTNPIYQWPDRIYYEGSSGRQLEGTETPEIRNANRMYYGNKDGVLTEQLCYGIYNLINTESVNFCMDMHEGSPEFLFLDCTMVNSRVDNAAAMSIASDMSLSMMLDGLDMRAEYSGVTSYGLSHRSLGDNTDCMMYLMETYNPSMGPLHGKMDDDLLINGNEPNYYQANKDGYIYFEVPEDGYTLESRTMRQMVCLKYLADAYSGYYPDKAVTIEGIYDYATMMDIGLGGVLKPINN